MINNNESYSLTPLQQGMVYNSLLSPNSGVEIEQILFILNEKINSDYFQKAWLQVTQNHPILRTKFTIDNRNQIQTIENITDIKIENKNLSHYSQFEKENEIEEYLKNDRITDFNISNAPLMRFALFKLAESQYKFVWTFHHALLDGRAFPIIINEVFQIYESYIEQKDVKLKEYQPFANYIKWLSARDHSDDKKYWKKILEGFDTPTKLNIGSIKSPKSKSIEYSQKEIRLSKNLSSSLKSFVALNGLSLNTLIHGAWAILLSKYTGEEKVIFGSSWSTRYSPIQGADTMVGLMINTLPMCLKVNPEDKLIDFLKLIRKQHIEQRPFINTPLKKIQQWANIKPDIPFFDTLVVFENYLLNSVLRSQGEKWNNREFIYKGQTSFPLTLAGYNDEEILLRLEFSLNHFEDESIKRILIHLETLLTSIIENHSKNIGNIQYISEQEKTKLLKEWNNTTTDYPRNTTIVKLFEDQTNETPNAIAISFNELDLTYKELNKQSNKIAHYLLSFGVSSETLVGLCLERSVEMIIAILGILKAGGAYVPLDPDYPKERLTFMLNDTQAPILISNLKFVSQFSGISTKVLCFEDEKKVIDTYSEYNPGSHRLAESLAYVMYTSGSTGQPKGIEVCDRNIVRLVKNTSYVALRSEDALLQYAPISFDASTFEIWGALLNGAKLVICPPGQITPDELKELIEINKITILWLTAALFHNIVEYNIDCLKSIRQLLAGGDVLIPASVKKLLNEFDSICLINGYGPTENTTFTCCFPMTSASQIGLSVPIGRPISNTTVYILDKNLDPLPIGVPGELYTSGDGVARGYLNRPELTKKSFIKNTFSDDPKSRLYKTGDLVRYLSDGNIEFLGRIDNQVKLRGYRIELGEIESVLLKHESIRQVSVIIREDRPGDKKLVAYFIINKPIDNYSTELKIFLQKIIPSYMIPQFFIKMEKFPITSNGKLDRKSLPPPSYKNSLSKNNSDKPKSETEEQMLKLWKEVLGNNLINIKDDFFDIGGDSLLAVVLFSKIHEKFEINLPLSTLFTAPTVEQLSKLLEDNKKSKVLHFNEILTNKTNIWSHLVKIKSTGSKTPLFCMHAVGGNVLNYNAFISYLNPQQPLLALQSSGLDGISKPMKDIETMASYYIKEIKQVQEKGPYLLCGASMGGQIALEVAQQLKRVGDEVGLLIMFDTYGPGYMDLISNSLSQNIKTGKSTFYYHFYKILDLSLKEKFKYVLKKLLFILTHKIKLFVCSAFYALKHPLPHKLRYWFVEEMNTKSSYKYIPKKYDGDIVLFSSSIKENDTFHDPEKNWGQIIKGKIEVIDIPANHYEFIEEPLLAKELSALLSKRYK